MNDTLDISPLEVIELAHTITTKAKKFSLTNRTLVTLKSESKRKKAGKIVTASGKDSQTMSKVINNHRVKMKHKGIRPIRESSREWSAISIYR